MRLKWTAVYKLWPSTSQIPRWNYAVLTLALGIFGSLFLMEGAASYLTTRRASQWPETQAMVTSSSQVGTPFQRRGFRYYPKVAYSFTVNDHTYEGRSVDYTKLFTDERPASAAYREGQHLSVRYEPGNPSNSFVPGMKDPVAAGGVTLGLFLLAIALFTWVRWRECRRGQG